MNKTTETNLGNCIYLIRLNGRFSGGSRLVAPRFYSSNCSGTESFCTQLNGKAKASSEQKIQKLEKSTYRIKFDFDIKVHEHIIIRDNMIESCWSLFWQTVIKMINFSSD